MTYKSFVKAKLNLLNLLHLKQVKQAALEIIKAIAAEWKKDCPIQTLIGKSSKLLNQLQLYVSSSPYIVDFISFNCSSVIPLHLLSQQRRMIEYRPPFKP